MSIRTKSELKAKFNTGDVPTEQDFNDLLDSLAGLLEDMSGAGKYIFNSPMDFSAEGSSFTAGMYQPVQASGLSLGTESGDFIDTCDGNLLIDSSSTCGLDGSGFVTLGKDVAGADFGDGRDGDATISSVVNINSQVISSGRSVADAVSYNVVGIGSNYADVTTAPLGIDAGDKVLVLNVQGTATGFVNVGNWEEFEVQSIADTRILFTTSKTKNFGAVLDDNIGVTSAQQRVILQRIPQYNNLTINSGSVKANAWNGVSGGIVAFKVKGIFSNSGSIVADGLGYRTTDYNTKGEGYKGYNVVGGGNSYGGSGYPPGSSYGTSGSVSNPAGAVVGETYGDANLNQLFFGAASMCNNNGHSFSASNGGGIVIIWAKTLQQSGIISADAAPAYEYAGGGAGGSVLLIASKLIFGLNTTRAVGATGQNGGSGGSGRIAVKYGAIVGNQQGAPTATLILPTGFASEGFRKSTNLVAGLGATGYSTFKAVVDSIPSSTSISISFSNNAADWTTPIALTVGTNNIDVSTFGWTSSEFYYKLDLSGDSSTTPKIDLLELTYTPVRYYTTDQFWVSKPISKPDLSAALPSSFFAMYEFLSGQAAPAFQLISSDNADMSNATVYPAADQYYKEGTANNINSGVRAYLSVQISEPKKYWQIKVKLNAGSVTTSSPIVSRLELEL